MLKIVAAVAAIPLCMVLAMILEGLGIPTPGALVWWLGGKPPQGNASLEGMEVWLTIDTLCWLLILFLAYRGVRTLRKPDANVHS